MTTDWLSNHALAESECRTGWAFEDRVAAALRNLGLTVEQPDKSWRANVDDRHRYQNELDLVCQGLRLSVKSRRVAFESPDTIPDNRNPLFVDTVRKWAIKTPEPWAVVCISQSTNAIIWLPTNTRSHWGVVNRYDYTRGYADDFMTADRSHWRPVTTLPDAIRTTFDGDWWLSTERMTVHATVTNGYVAHTAPIARKFVGQPFGNLVGHMRKQPGFRSRRVA